MEQRASGSCQESCDVRGLVRFVKNVCPVISYNFSNAIRVDVFLYLYFARW